MMADLRAHDVDMLTIGQYLAPSAHHLPVRRYVPPDTFAELAAPRPADGLCQRRQRAAGALVLPRRPAGRRPRRGLSMEFYAVKALAALLKPPGLFAVLLLATALAARRPRLVRGVCASAARPCCWCCRAAASPMRCSIR